ncbi:MAG TPA: DUF2299 family protein [Candidatus Thalassarchaeaceae archaeon]|nr:DUF2299 family protein [Candidatus Thalassarchaeaceae archaeon]|tara:strand:+ start:7344 stop:7970 length:627 start_codon:yes stop_codon:yes gene_type:complete
MDASEAGTAIASWLHSERLETREVKDPQAALHLHVRYPPTKQGHLFNVVIPKNRNLALVYSITRVDEGQQQSMREMATEDSEGWEEWLHDTRINLTSSDLDWVLHVGRGNGPGAGPLQAFNLSRPVWFDGLTQNEFMHAMRRVWLTKLSMIHQIKFGFGPGTGKPGPVDDWQNKGAKRGTSSSQPRLSDIDTDETGGFGKDFDPLEWA